MRAEKETEDGLLTTYSYTTSSVQAKCKVRININYAANLCESVAVYGNYVHIAAFWFKKSCGLVTSSDI